MGISHTEPFQIIKSCVLQSIALALGAFAFVVFEAKADGYEECNQILSKDIFNRINQSESSILMSEAEKADAFFSQDSSEAYEAYSSAFDRAEENNTSVDAEFHYGPIGGELGIDISSKERIQKSEFEEKFNAAVSTRSHKSSSSSKSSANLVSNYASYVRDAGTVDAWRDCVTKTKDTNIYAFASRDHAGQTFVNVIWVPGPLAGIIPSIPITFVTAAGGDDDGVKIHAEPGHTVGIGSGTSFAVSCGKICDDGFQITVNGTLKNSAGVAAGSFTSNVDVPALRPPEPPKPPQTDKELMVEFERERSAVYDRCGERTVGDCKGLVEAGKKYKELEVIDSQCKEKQDNACWQRMKALAREILPLFRNAGKGIE